MNELLPLTGLMFGMGIGAIVYGTYFSSLFIVLQGIYIMFLAIKITMTAWETQRITDS
jgi:hypothetical protein